eukprot:Blabericola_migrator_1__2887@NODE_182_length_11861_cov_167_496185_g158_i0_p6_GENE_NODE_182_length_11861_cov_167_496185_g158_i0NODE_182_length_11861_cov_167_496185_g158_i0_p6_ORF_typecomplete_len205_score17_97_NODE_182_length_11861_cov_167_496185_g158_i073477961
MEEECYQCPPMFPPSVRHAVDLDLRLKMQSLLESGKMASHLTSLKEMTTKYEEIGPNFTLHHLKKSKCLSTPVLTDLQFIVQHGLDLLRGFKEMSQGDRKPADGNPESVTNGIFTASPQVDWNIQNLLDDLSGGPEARSHNSHASILDQRLNNSILSTMSAKVTRPAGNEKGKLQIFFVRVPSSEAYPGDDMSLGEPLIKGESV